jgi:hypothetical protein
MESRQVLACIIVNVLLDLLAQNAMNMLVFVPPSPAKMEGIVYQK